MRFVLNHSFAVPDGNSALGYLFLTRYGYRCLPTKQQPKGQIVSAVSSLLAVICKMRTRTNALLDLRRTKLRHHSTTSSSPPPHGFDQSEFRPVRYPQTTVPQTPISSRPLRPFRITTALSTRFATHDSESYVPRHFALRTCIRFWIRTGSFVCQANTAIVAVPGC